MVLTLAAIEAELAVIRLYTRGYSSIDGVLTRDGHSTTAGEAEDLKLSLARFEFLVGEAAQLRSSN
jgi:hypothetical protein